MNDILGWLSTYSPPIVALILVLAALLYLLKQVVDRSITAGFAAHAKEVELALSRRSAFEEKVLIDRYTLITGLSERLQRVMTNLNRIRHGKPVPEGFMVQNELPTLTEIFEDLEIQRVVLGDEFHQMFLRQAQIALHFANAPKGQEDPITQEWLKVLQQTREAVEQTFRISQIHA
ncbi:MAG TPA: hypothetical protein VFR37_09280 [Longimicrobium sp.]|nr:hypothetical protein [Longimicrobium sp.]